MIGKQIDLLCIGDITTDAFIKLKQAEVHCKLNTDDCEICFPFGDKIPFESVKVVKAVGNASNASVASARLGLRSALLSNIGSDQNGKECLEELQKNRVITSLIKIHKDKPTNYHFVLSYKAERTILVNHIDYDYRLPDAFHENKPYGKIFNRGIPPKWIYLTSLATNSYPYHIAIADYLDKNPSIKLAFQPGTFQIKLGKDELKRIYSRTEILVVNLSEAYRILNIAEKNTLTQTSPKRDIKDILKSLSELGQKITIITDNTNGAYMFDGDHYYHMPMYPDPRPAVDRTGCGDAFTATFVSALVMNKTPLEALTMAPINPMSVAQFIGAQEGLLTLDQIEWWLKRAPDDYRPREMR